MHEEITPLKKLVKEGLLLVDKPSGVTSHDVVDWARRVTRVRKIGHTGTLDPLATGLLALLIGRKYTRLQNTFLKQDKEYFCLVELGVETDTYDIDGQVINRAGWDRLKNISEKQLQKVSAAFQGTTHQTVPAYSAVKRRGKKLYELARSGELDLNTLPERQVEIYDLQLKNFVKDSRRKKMTFDLQIHCSSGTYVRSIVHELGERLGVGAVVVELRRTKIGSLDLKDALICPIFPLK